MSEFGPIIDYARVEDAIRDGAVRPWIDTYLVAVERENDLPARTITRPRDWKILDDLTLTPEKNLPVLYVISAGDSAAPDDDGEGALSGLISMGVLIAAKDTTRDTTRSLARRYGAAVAALVDQKLGTAGLGIRLASTPRQNFDETVNRSTQRAFIMAVAYVTFDVQVDVIRYRRGGPDEPFPPPETPRDPNAPPNPLDPDRIDINVVIDVDEDVT